MATKVGVFIDSRGRSMRDFSRDIVNRQFDASRRRLGRDAIDIEILHSPSDAEYSSGASLDALHKLRADGNVRFAGVLAIWDLRTSIVSLSNGTKSTLLSYR